MTTNANRIRKHAKRMLRKVRAIDAMKRLPGGGRGGVWWPDGMTGQEVKAAFRNKTMKPRSGAEPGSLSASAAGCNCSNFARVEYLPGQFKEAWTRINPKCRWHGDSPEAY